MAALLTRHPSPNPKAHGTLMKVKPHGMSTILKASSCSQQATDQTLPLRHAVLGVVLLSFINKKKYSVT